MEKLEIINFETKLNMLYNINSSLDGAPDSLIVGFKEEVTKFILQSMEHVEITEDDAYKIVFREPVSDITISPEYLSVLPEINSDMNQMMVALIYSSRIFDFMKKKSVELDVDKLVEEFDNVVKFIPKKK